MITLRVWRDAGGNVVRYRLNGHSPSGEAGNNVVCAAVSALAIATANGLEAVVGATVTAKSGPGCLDCEVVWPTRADAGADASSEGIRLRAQAVLDTMLLGMQSISQEHPHDLKVIDERNAGK
jgi:uncharacterized protein YsxB (DUF464 family)